MLEQLFLFIVQLFCLADTSAVPLHGLLHATPVSVGISAMPTEQRQKLIYSLTAAAGFDDRLSKLEWITYAGLFGSTAQLEPELRTALATQLSIRPHADAFEQVLNHWELSLHRALHSDRWQQADIFVYGDDLPAVFAAVAAARRLGPEYRVVLARPRPQESPFGGVLTRGQLAYLDRNQLDGDLTPSSELFGELLKSSGVERIALDPKRADSALRKMLSDSGVEVLNDFVAEPIRLLDSITHVLSADGTRRLRAKIYIDGSAEGLFARAAGLRFHAGFSQLGLPHSAMRVTPVFITRGLSPQGLLAIEGRILRNTQLMAKLKKKYSKLMIPAWVNG